MLRDTNTTKFSPLEFVFFGTFSGSNLEGTRVLVLQSKNLNLDTTAVLVPVPGQEGTAVLNVHVLQSSFFPTRNTW